MSDPIELSAGTGRRSRWTRRIGKAVVFVLAATGLLSIYSLFNGAPGVGHFRSVEGRQEYVRHYADAMAAMPTPTATIDVPTDFGTVRVYEWSSPVTASSIPIVLVPGRSSGVPMWSENLAGFAQSHRVLAFDALGDAGLSVQVAPLTSFDDQAIWMHQVLSELAPDGAHVVGHSFGGATAAAYARLHPERVRSLVLLEPVFTFANPPAGLMGWAVLASLPGLPQSIRETALGKIGGVEYDGTDATAKMITAGTEHFAAVLPNPSRLSEEEAGKLTMPVYVAVASRDSLAGGATAAGRAEEVLPSGEVVVWDDTTHSLPMQVADRLSEALDEFWESAEH